MSAHTTLTIPRSAALTKLRDLDINDLPEKLKAWLVNESFAIYSREVACSECWGLYSNEDLEKILDKLFYEFLWNFYIIDDDIFDFYLNDNSSPVGCLRKSIMHLPFPSILGEKAQNLQGVERKLYERLSGEGFKAKDIFALFATRKKD